MTHRMADMFEILITIISVCTFELLQIKQQLYLIEKPSINFSSSTLWNNHVKYCNDRRTLFLLLSFGTVFVLRAPQSEFDLALPAVQGSSVEFLSKASVAAACFALQPSLALTVERNKAVCFSGNPASKGSCSVTIKQPMNLNLWLMRGTWSLFLP